MRGVAVVADFDGDLAKFFASRLHPSSHRNTSN